MGIVWLVIACIGALAVGFVAFTGAPYVPSKRRDVRRALTELYHVHANDVLVDIGSGDGVVLREASWLGARAVGYEIHPVLVALSKWLSRHDERVTIIMANFWNAELPADTTVVYTFGDSRDITRMYQKVQQEAVRLQRSLAFITYGFDVPGAAPSKTVGAHHLYVIEPLQ